MSQQLNKKVEKLPLKKVNLLSTCATLNMEVTETTVTKLVLFLGISVLNVLCLGSFIFVIVV